MAHTYHPSVVIKVSTLTARTASALGHTALTAGDTEAAKLPGGKLPAFLLRPWSRLSSAVASLDDELVPRASEESPSPRESDLALDSTWAGLYGVLQGYARSPTNPQPEGVAALQESAFDGGLTFLTLDFRSQWAESRARLEVLGQPRHRQTLDALGLGVLVAGIEAAQEVYGEALGITVAADEEAQPKLRVAMEAVRGALKEWIVKAMAWADPEEPGSEALSRALLKPLEEWEPPAPRGGATPSAGEQELEEPTPANAAP